MIAIPEIHHALNKVVNDPQGRIVKLLNELFMITIRWFFVRNLVLFLVFFDISVQGQSTVRLNEILANPLASLNPSGKVTDWVELYNSGSNEVNLAGLSLTDDPLKPRKWVFPIGVKIGSRSFLQVVLTGDEPASIVAQTVLNAGFGLKLSGSKLSLLSADVVPLVLDSVDFGLQVPDLSIGRIPDATGPWGLNKPTPKSVNQGQTLSATSGLRVNEWMANPSSGDDWFELYNSGSSPVALEGLCLTDDLTKKSLFPIHPLSFIGVGADAYFRFWASGKTNSGHEHVSFSLKAGGEALGVFSATGVQIDAVTFATQGLDVSQGRLPDGSPTIVTFSQVPSPAASNFEGVTGLIVNELLSHTDPPLEDAVEFMNTSDQPINIGGWFLSNKSYDLKKWMVPLNTRILAHGFKVFYENDFNANNPLVPFTFNSAHGDGVYLSQADATGKLTGYRIGEVFEASQNGVSFGRYATSVSGDYKFVAMSSRSFGEDDPLTIAEFRRGTGLTNPPPRVGPIVFNEVFFHPPAIGTNDNLADEFIELFNLTSEFVPLFDPNNLNNRWKLQNGTDFTFPQGIILSPFSYLLVVSFNPVFDLNAAAVFRAKWAVPAGVELYGPFVGKLSNNGSSIELYKPDPPQKPPHPDAGFVPYIRVDKINFSDLAPWPSDANGTGRSIQRKNSARYGNDPINWQSSLPTAGVGNSPEVADRDGDGMPDLWENANGFNLADATDGAKDADGDRFTNLQEFIAGTNPRDASSRFRILSVQPPVGITQPLRLTFSSVSGKSYTVQYRAGLGSAVWQKLVGVDATASTTTVEDLKSVDKVDRYYRVVTPPVD